MDLEILDSYPSEVLDKNETYICKVTCFDNHNKPFWGCRIGEIKFSVHLESIEESNVLLDISQSELITRIEPSNFILELRTNIEGEFYNYTLKVKEPGLYCILIYTKDGLQKELIVNFYDDFTSKSNPDAASISDFKKYHLHAGLKNNKFGDLTKFREWSKNKKWNMFGPNYSHYDWYMFPIRKRASYPQFAVEDKEIQMLLNDIDYMRNYREGVCLLALAWGWNVKNYNWVANPDNEMGWNNWSVRLGKVGMSLIAFNQMDLFNSMRNFLISLRKRKEQNKQISINEQFGVHPEPIFFTLVDNEIHFPS